MIVFRSYALVVMLGLLSACDSAETPVPNPPKAPTVEAPEKAPAPPEAKTAVAPSAPVAAKAPAVPQAERQAERLAEPQAAPLTVEPAVEFDPALQLPTSKAEEPDAMPAPVEKPPAPVQEKPAEKKAVARRQPSKAVPVEQAKLPDVPLDLSLPQDMLDKLQPVDAQASMDPELLPPMFDEKPDQDPFQLNGRLLTRERQDEIEGAELQFEFKR
ncbi:MAG: hypothetical protein V4812_05320 [Pseudomonadota bacterium]